MKLSNILSLKVGADERAEGGGRKRFKNSCMSIRSTKKGLISSARCNKTYSQSSYFALNHLVMEVLVCTGVLIYGDAGKGFGGGVVGGVMLIGDGWEQVALG